MVKTAKVSNGNIKISEHFRLKELQCKDGTDLVKYCPETLEKVEKLRELTQCTACIVTSGYRTPSHNKAIGGASSSTHTQGYAIDCYFKGSKYSTKEICCMAQDLSVKGIGYISSTAVHLDMKNRTYRGDETKDYSNNVGGDFYKYFNIEHNLPTSKIDISKFPILRKNNKNRYYTRILQEKLKAKGFKGANGKVLNIDGLWGENTSYAVQSFQRLNGLVVDNIVGKKTWKALFN